MEVLLIINAAHLGGSVIMFFLNFFADKITDKEFLSSRKPSPSYASSFVNRLFYVWVTPLMWSGFRNPLTMTDLWDISPKVASKNVNPEFSQAYNASVEKAKYILFVW